MIVSHVGRTSQQIATANLMPERNTPVTFVGDPPPAEVVVPVKAAKKAKP